MYRLLLFVYLAITLGFLPGCSPVTKSKNEIKSEGLQLRDIRLQTLSGDDIDLNDYKGKTIFINFWATWCKPCLQEMPSIQEAMRRVDTDQVIFIFPSNESTEEIKNFKEKRGYPFNFVRITNLESLNFYALPVTLIFDTEGNLIFKEEGMRDWSTEENLALLAKPETNN